jgi:nitrous oxide reductase
MHKGTDTKGRLPERSNLAAQLQQWNSSSKGRLPERSNLAAQLQQCQTSTKQPQWESTALAQALLAKWVISRVRFRQDSLLPPA